MNSIAPRIAPCTVPPELRRLRNAWAWARDHHMDLDLMAADCPALRERAPTTGEAFSLSGVTVSGGMMSVRLTRTQICINRIEARYEDSHVLDLPARLRRGAAPSGGAE